MCVCVCSSIDADTGNQNFYLRIGWVGGWALGNTNVLRTENNTLYLRTAPKVLRADGRLVNMSGVFCTNNVRSYIVHRTIVRSYRRSYVETVSGNSALLQSNGITVSTYDRLLVSVPFEKREGACTLFVQKTPNR